MNELPNKALEPLLRQGYGGQGRTSHGSPFRGSSLTFVESMNCGLRALGLVMAFISTGVCCSGTTESASTGPAEAILLHRIFTEFYFTSEHFEGEESELGDALGADCLIQRVTAVTGRKGAMVRAFEGDGMRNEEWYGWNAEVLAPFDCVVERIHINPTTNLPGEFGKAPASSIVFLRSDGMRVMFAHIQNPRVRIGDRLIAGQVVAHVGNNGYGSCPHIHVGAWKEGRAYQIRWNLRSGKTKHP